MDGADEAEPVGPLASFGMKSGIIRDRVRAVADGTANGAYLYGPPGTGKTFNVRQTLEAEGRVHYYTNGHLTPIGLFDLLAERNADIVVIDDVCTIFNSPQSLNILLAALGNQPGGERLIKYSTALETRVTHFTGGIILLSNLRLKDNPVQQALASRVHCIEFDPTQTELEAFLRDAARCGWSRHGLADNECHEILDHVIAECERLSCRLDLRLVFDKAYPDFAQAKIGRTETDWRDLVSATVKQRADEISRSAVSETKANQVAAEVEVARQINAEYADRPTRLKIWTEKTGKDERTFYRRVEASRKPR